MRALSFFSFFLFASSVLAQQKDFALQLESKLLQYYEANAPMRAHVMVNQPAFIPGDTVHMNVVLTTVDNIPVKGSRILKAKLVNSKSEIVLSQKFRATDGFASSYLAIPASFREGAYALVVYDDWMLNSDPSLFAYHPILLESDHQVSFQKVFTLGYSAEGGKLIRNLTNKIVVTGLPNNTYDVVSSAFGVIQSVSMNAFGFATLLLKPAAGQYFLKGRTESVELAIVDDGVAQQTIFEDDKIKCQLQVPENSVFRADRLHFAVTQHHNVLFHARVDLKTSANAIIEIPKDVLSQDLTLLTVFNAQGEAISERLIQLTNTTPEKIIEINTSEVQPRETLSASVAAKPGSIFHAAAYQENIFQSDREPENHSYLCKDIPLGSFGVPHGLIKTGDVSLWNDYLITQQWKQFTWRDVWSSKTEQKIKSEELVTLKGKIKSASEKQLPDSLKITFLLENDVSSYQAYVNPDGSFVCPFSNDFYGKEYVFYRVSRKATLINDVQVDIEGPSAPIKVPFVSQVKNIPSRYADFAQDRRDFNMSYSVGDVKRRSTDITTAIEEEVFNADNVVKVGDYVALPTMEEAIREIIPYVQHRKKNGEHTVRLWLNDKTIAKGAPVYVIDGVITDNTNYFMQLAPADILSVKLIRKREKLQAFGVIGANGIVIVQTKRGNKALVPMSDHSFEVEGLALPLKGKAGSPALRTPLINSTVAFIPKMIIDSSSRAAVSLQAPDNVGVFAVIVQGFTPDGKFFWEKRTFENKFKNAAQ